MVFVGPLAAGSTGFKLGDRSGFLVGHRKVVARHTHQNSGGGESRRCADDAVTTIRAVMVFCISSSIAVGSRKQHQRLITTCAA